MATSRIIQELEGWFDYIPFPKDEEIIRGRSSVRTTRGVSGIIRALAGGSPIRTARGSSRILGSVSGRSPVFGVTGVSAPPGVKT